MKEKIQIFSEKNKMILIFSETNLDASEKTKYIHYFANITYILNVKGKK